MPATTSRVSAAGPVPRSLEPRDLADLRATPSAGPCISVLMPTEPGPRMSPGDVRRLWELADDVDRALRAQGVPGRVALMRRLGALMTRTAGQPTDRGLAIFVNGELERVFRLPLSVPRRGVVEATFAIRALFTLLHRMPPYVLLVLHPTCAHLYQGGDGILRAVGDRDVFRGSAAARVPRRGERQEDGAGAEVTDAFLHGVDRLLGSYRTEHPSPLVLAGPPHLVDRFCTVSSHLHRLAGRVPSTDDLSPLDLVAASADVVIRYLASRRDEALARLRAALASRPGDVARGMAECWQQVHQRPPGLLIVEEGCTMPGRPEDDSSLSGGTVTAAACTTWWTTSWRWSSCEAASSRW